MKLATPLAIVGIVALGWAGAALLTTTRAQAAAIKLAPAFHAPYDPSDIDREIAFHQLRTQNDPNGAIGWKMLSAAYLARSRESDMDTAAWKAEDAARKSLRARAERNDEAQVKLVQSMLEQHRFRDALAEARKIPSFNPENTEAPKLVADCLIEIGDYKEAGEVLSSIAADPRDYALIATKAHLASAVGNHTLALRLYNEALRIATDLPTVTEPNLAWLNTKIGTEYETMGETEMAQQLFEKSVRLYPRSYKATLGLGRCSLESGNLTDAERWANRTLEIANSLDAKAILCEVARRRQDLAKVAAIQSEILEQFKDEVATFDKMGKGGPLHVRPIDRQFATFAANNGVFTEEALEAAKRDHANRPDATAKRNLTILRGKGLQ